MKSFPAIRPLLYVAATSITFASGNAMADNTGTPHHPRPPPPFHLLILMPA